MSWDISDLRACALFLYPSLKGHRAFKGGTVGLSKDNGIAEPLGANKSHGQF